MGRADQTTKVRGMFVHPEQVARVAARHPEILKARLVVVSGEAGRDAMTLRCAVDGPGSEALAAAIAATLQSECKLRGAVVFTTPYGLPNDGKVIEDARTYE
jgi:phenylacetate-CoA ligase